MTDIASRVTSDYWADRFEQAETDEDVMGIAWSYLLANLRGAVCSPVRLNELRRQAANALIEIATVEELR